MDEFAFRPTHVAAPDGMATWAAPDPSQPSTPLDPLLPVRLIDRRGDWAYVLCSNGWSTWVDGRLLVALPDTPPAPGAPPPAPPTPAGAGRGRGRPQPLPLAAGGPRGRPGRPGDLPGAGPRPADRAGRRRRGALGVRRGPRPLVLLRRPAAADLRSLRPAALQPQLGRRSGVPRPPVAPATPRPPGAGPAAPPGGYEPTRTGEP
ncbi:hypothetical protein ACFQ0M_42445 [Kitasatospora aburaviensis]